MPLIHNAPSNPRPSRFPARSWACSLSGIADLYTYSPVSDFSYITGKYVILYFFAGNDQYASTGGFEEWVAFTKSSPTVPDNSSGLLLGSNSLAGLLSFQYLLGRRFKKRRTDRSALSELQL